MKNCAGYTRLVFLGSFFLVLTMLSSETVRGATLSSLDVTPADSTINVSQTQPFTVTGHYSDGSTRPLSLGSHIATGGYHTCAVVYDGTVLCWGDNRYGQLGNVTNANDPFSTVVGVIGITSATAIAAGADRTCAVLSDGSVKCWGLNEYGTLGNGTYGGPDCGGACSITPVTVSGISTATAIAVGRFHTCALLSDGTVKCWGDNFYGQLGNGVHTDSYTPVSVSGISTATAVAAGDGYTCVVLSNGTVNCWGYNRHGQLGDGKSGTSDINNSDTPVPVIGITTATAVAAEGEHTCALLSDGTVKCWGDNEAGGLGDGTTVSNSKPVSVSGISTAIAVDAGLYHTCAQLSDGTVQCWGFNFYGQLGNGHIADSNIPVPVRDMSTAAAIAAGGNDTCAVLSDGRVQCWGENDTGALGDGSDFNQGQPVSVIGISTGIFTATAVAAGYEHTCALLSDGTVKCWGLNDVGQVGDGYINGTDPVCNYICNPTPVSVSGISTATAVAAGKGHTCAVLFDGMMKCWGGDSFGQLGNGFTGIASTPLTVSGISTATAIAAGDIHTCAVLSDSTVKCWGSNAHGQLGNGTFAGPDCGGMCSATPVTVSGISTATAIAAGVDHTCAVLSDGTVKCWGSNTYGQLGGLSDSSSTPVAVSGISTATAVAAGYQHTCVVLSDGTVTCWGQNKVAQLGNGTKSTFSTPVTAGATVNAVVLTSSDTGVAPMNAYGVATGFSPGTTTITATSGSISGNTTLTVNLNTFTLTLNAAGTGSGTVSGAGAYYSGETAPVTATANTGSTFAGWSGANGAECTAGSVLMNADKSCTATFTAAPDLFMTAVTLNSATANQGGTLSVTDTVINQGAASAGSFRLAYYLSPDSIYGNGDELAISTIRAVTNPFATGGTSTATTSLAIPSATPGGTYYLCALADSLNQVAESMETNNARCSASTVTLPKADLVMTTVSTATTVIAPGQSLSAANSVMNQGGFAAGSFRIGFYLSMNANGSTQDGTITATRTLSSLAAGASSSGTTSLTLPSSMMLGNYYLCAMADSLSQVAESDEGNNTLCTGSTIQVTLPDLTMSVVTPNASTASPGGTLSVTDTVSNGGAASGVFRISYRLSPTASYSDPGAVVITITRSVTSLAAGVSSTGTTTLTLPGATPSGTYYVCTLADSLNQVTETNEGNNTLCSGATVTVP